MTITDLFSVDNLYWILNAVSILGVIIVLFLMMKRLEQPVGNDMITSAFLNLHREKIDQLVSDKQSLEKLVVDLQNKINHYEQIEDMIDHAERTGNTSC